MNSNVSNTDALQFWESTGANPRLTITQAGSVGIGTATPDPLYKLDVAGKVRSSSGGFVFPDGTVLTTASGTGAGAANVAAGQFGQNVGGGNYSFPGNVDIGGAITWGSSNSRTDSKDNAGAVASKSGFFETASPTNYPSGASSWWHLIEARHSNNTNNYALQIAGSFFDQNLYTRKINNNGATAWSKFILQDANGNVGIGNTNPTERLDVAGNINVTGTGNITATGTITGGTIYAKYQDVAEWVPSTQELSAGTVVVLDHERSNHVVASSQTYDTRVAGVVSAQPGVIWGRVVQAN